MTSSWCRMMDSTAGRRCESTPLPCHQNPMHLILPAILSVFHLATLMKFPVCSCRNVVLFLVQISGKVNCPTCMVTNETSRTDLCVTSSRTGMKFKWCDWMTQVRHPGGVPFAVLIACLIVAMAVVYFTQQVGPSGGKAKKGRSTDRVD